MIKVNVGCGWRNFGKDWIHIDSGDYDHLDYKTDVRNLPFENNSIDMIYSSHVIAYFDRDEINDVLKEWNRVLIPGGLLRIATPDFKAMSDLYINGDINLSAFLGPLYGKMKCGDSIIYHKTCYDFDSLSRLLPKNGFDHPERYDWRKTEHSHIDDHSQAYIPHMDKENGTLISLNIQTIKKIYDN